MATATKRWILPMRPRDPDEGHRAATPLELFFDLVFVVAIAQAAAGLHHGLSEAHVFDAVLNYFLVFFAVWWAWMGFTWFATSFDNDDVPYRLAVLVQLTGALVLAAGVTPAFENQDYTLVLAGYVIMRVAMIAQILRAMRWAPEQRGELGKWAASLLVLQTLWVVLIQLDPKYLVPGIILIGTAEMVSVAVTKSLTRSWHAGHIAERYGLLTIIVLGETVLAAAVALHAIFAANELTFALAPTIGGGLLALYAMWWLYFDRDAPALLTDIKRAFIWGYGHLVVYASAAAVGAGLLVMLDHQTGHGHSGLWLAGMAVAVPASIYVMALWLLHERPGREPGHLAMPVVAVLLLGAPWLYQPVLAVGLALAGLVAWQIVIRTIRSNNASGTPETG